LRLTKSTDFAMRILMYLAKYNEQVTMLVLAEKIQVPYNHLTKLIQLLSKSGYIATKQGKCGGIKLLRAVSDINLKSVMDIVEGPVRLSDCLCNEGACSVSFECKLKEAFYVVQSKIDTVLEDVKLEHVI
jgi:Rrf2 family protein